MLTAYVLLKLVTIAASLLMATAILARDPGLRLNRLMAGVLACTAYWAGCEALWTLQDDPAVVIWMVRASSLAWLLVGPLFLDTYVELTGDARGRLRALVPFVYLLSGLGMLVYVAMPTCLEQVVPTPWGWGFRFGRLFLFPFLIASVPPTLVLFSWRAVHPRQGSGGERSVSRAAFIGLTFSIVIASATDASLPFMGVQVPALGSTAIMTTAILIAVRLRRYGHSLLSAGSFAKEILDTLSDGVVLLHPGGHVRDCNAAFERLTGRSRESLRELGIQCVLPGLPGGVELAEAREGTLLRASGDGLPVLISKPVLCRVGDRVVGAAVAVRDLREVTDIRQRLITSARLAAVGSLSAGIAEEIMRPIVMVRECLDALRQHWHELGEAVRKLGTADADYAETIGEGMELIDESLEGVERIRAIARDVRGFAGSGGQPRQATDVASLVESSIRMALPRAPAGVVVVRDLAPVPPILCASQEIAQVFMNLLVNAFHASAEGGEVRVAIESRDGLVVVHVQDDGPGIDPALLDRIFDPFFTTKKVGEGTGLGLAISYHIVRNHGGEIRVATSEGSGTTFSVELPAL